MPFDLGNLGKDLGTAALTTFKGQVSGAWASWTVAERELVELAVEDAAKIALRALVDPVGAATEKKHIDAQLQAIKVAANVEASKVLWATLSEILMKAATIALGAVL